MIEPPYAWPGFDGKSEKTAAAIDIILAESFNRSGTKIRDREAIVSAARHIAQTDRLHIEDKPRNSQVPWFPENDVNSFWGTRFYTNPSRNVTDENNAAVLYQVIRDSFAQSATKVRDDKAILSAARRVAQSTKFTMTLPAAG